MNIRFFVLANVLLIYSFFCSAQTTSFGEVDAVLQRYQKDLGTNFAVLVQKDGKDVYKNLSGDMKLDSQEPIASCSKWLTAALVMNLVDEGKISLDDPIAKYLPIFASYSKSYITIRHCLSQTTGIENEPLKLTTLLQRKKYETLEAEVNDFASKKDIKAKPGTQFFYGGIGLNIAGRICEVVTKKPFDRLIGERILKPLLMRKTNFQTDGMTAINPSNGAKSSPADYMKFLDMLLHKGVGNGKKILSPESVEEILKIQTNNVVIKYVPVVATGYKYGLGCWIQEMENDKATVISCPGLFGTWPYIDVKKNYSAIIFTKSLLNGEDKRNIYQHIKETIDAAMN